MSLECDKYHLGYDNQFVYCLQQGCDQQSIQQNKMMTTFEGRSSSSLFNCLFCVSDEDPTLAQKRKEAIFIDQFKNHQSKISLRNTFSTNPHPPHFKTQNKLTKSNVKRNHIAQKNPNEIILSPEDHAIRSNKLLQTTPSLLQKTHSLRSTHQTFFQPTPSKATLPKINFTYNNSSPSINCSIKQSIININANFQELNQLDFPPKISLINKISTSSNLASQQLVFPQPSQHVSSSTSPLNKIYKASHKQILVSKQLKKKSSTSFQSPGKLKRLSSFGAGQPFARQKLKIRQTQSIREPQEESDLYSIVLSNNSIIDQSNNNFGLLIPIDENQYQTKLSSYKD